MRKVFFMAAVLLVSAFGFAQPKMNVVSLPGLDVQYKRCVVNGSSCYFDFLFTNVSNTPSASLSIMDSSCGNYSSIKFGLYDDEGNKLNYYANSTIYIANEHTTIGHFPKDVPVKVRIAFTNVDEYATMFTLLQIPMTFNNTECGYIELRNVPIVRRDQ